MNGSRPRPSERRKRLIAQAAAQRTALAQNIVPWRIPLALADQGLAVLRYIQSHPVVWLIGGIVMFSVLRPGGVGKWLRRGWVTWQIARRWQAGSQVRIRSPEPA